MMLKFRDLNADEIDMRIGQVGEGYFTLLCYKDARVDMDILDETVGAERWQRRHYEVKSNLYCEVGIHFEGVGWVFKGDCGTESNTEKEKGEASDSFKRACVNWGIGRELYTAPKIFITYDCKKGDRGDVIKLVDFRVDELQVSDKQIVHIAISAYDKNAKERIVIFPKNSQPSKQMPKKTPPPKAEAPSNQQKIVEFITGTMITAEIVAETITRLYGRAKANDLNEAQFNKLITELEGLL